MVRPCGPRIARSVKRQPVRFRAPGFHHLCVLWCPAPDSFKGHNTIQYNTLQFSTGSQARSRCQASWQASQAAPRPLSPAWRMSASSSRSAFLAKLCPRAKTYVRMGCKLLAALAVLGYSVLACACLVWLCVYTAAGLTCGAPLQDGQLVTFSEVVGMTELNDGKPRRIRNCKVHHLQHGSERQCLTCVDGRGAIRRCSAL